MHIHAADPSITMHRAVRIIVLCVVTVLLAVGSELSVSRRQGQAENYSIKLNASHGMRRGGSRANPDGRKQLPISLGFKCAYCGGEFGSRSGMDSHRRHRNSTGTPCADPMNSKSMSFTGRADGSAGILRQHDVLGEQHIDALLFMYHVRFIIVHTIIFIMSIISLMTVIMEIIGIIVNNSA